MKTRELTAGEIKLNLSAQDISNIQYDADAEFPADSFALKSLETALQIRGRGTNIFVCGPSAPEREAAVLKAAKTMKQGRINDILLCENPADSIKPLIKKLEPGTASSFICDETAAGRKASLLIPGKAPVVIENNPVPEQLFGIDAGELSSVRAGSLAKSAGGILLLNAEDLLEEEESWKLLKRVLRTGRTVIGAEAAGAETRHPAAASNGNNDRNLILPELELDLKVVVVGSEPHFDHFYNNDEDFRELFPFFAEFDSVIEMNDQNLAASVNYLRRFTIDKLNKKLSDEAALEAIKFSVASAENNIKLSTLRSELELLLTEAAADCEIDAADCEIDAADCITAGQVSRAVKNQGDRFGLLERRIIEDITSGEINLKVDGYETGKVNGLAIIDKGPWSFGIPGLISARIAPGENGLVNIEHEAGLSGEIHDKWVLILEGFLRSRFAMDFPISIFASICFEQSYSEIDGDSASSSELYALLSAISGVPIRQDIAVTGSLSQTGEIQAVGGLREKIEGFYKACKAINFTGMQGVIIPERNIKNIILPDEIISDIAGGRFHIYPVTTVDDSMELLTGKEAGERNSRGAFPNGSLNHLIEKNLKKLAVQAKNFGN